MKINGAIFRPGANLPGQFHSQGDKDAEIARIEKIIDEFPASISPSVRRLADQRLRKVRGIGVRQ